MAANTQSRKYLITINNPVEKGFTHEKIKDCISKIKNIDYWCMCDETGDNGTYHTHVFVHRDSPIRFSTLQKAFKYKKEDGSDGCAAHIDLCNGTSKQNRDYIRKEGKYADSDKKETNHPETFEEFGNVPNDKKSVFGNGKDLDLLYDMLQSNFNNAEIISQDTSFILDIDRIDRARNTLREEKYKNTWRDVECHYIYGVSGTGKTRSVMDEFGYSNVYRVTNYLHPFDAYQGQDVILFDEFRGRIPLADMLNYLDGYPLLLPARYGDKVACYTKVFIVSNIPLTAQYTNMQLNESVSWNAFLRRINDLTYYNRSGKYTQTIFPGCYIKHTNEFERLIENENEKASSKPSKLTDDEALSILNNISDFVEILP